MPCITASAMYPGATHPGASCAWADPVATHVIVTSAGPYPFAVNPDSAGIRLNRSDIIRFYRL